jgi:hypothetical protein
MLFLVTRDNSDINRFPLHVNTQKSEKSEIFFMARIILSTCRASLSSPEMLFFPEESRAKRESTKQSVREFLSRVARKKSMHGKDFETITPTDARISNVCMATFLRVRRRIRGGFRALRSA